MAATVPFTYDAITDRVIRLDTVVPTLAAAGASVVDPLFGCRVYRLTDGNTGTGKGMTANYGRYTYSAPNQRLCNSDSTKFVIRDDSGNNLVMNFNPSTGVSSEDRIVSWGIEGSWSKTNPSLIYGTRFIATHDVEVYDFTASGGAGAYSTILDLDSIDGTLTGSVYLNSLYASGGSTPRIAVLYGGASQGTHMKITVFEIANPANRHTINVATNQIDGVQALDQAGANFSFEGELVHSIAISNDGNFVRIDPNWNSSNGFWLYDYTLNRMKKVLTRPSGHYALGWARESNEDASGSAKPQWQVRSLVLANAETVDPRRTTALTPTPSSSGDHQSWHNARTADDANAPFFSEWQHLDPTGSIGWSAWANEIIGVQSTGAELVWRFCHHHCSPYGDVTPTAYPFQYQPLANVDPSGQWVFFTSNWGKTLGNTSASLGAEITKRTDVFAVRLAREAQATVIPRWRQNGKALV